MEFLSEAGGGVGMLKDSSWSTPISDERVVHLGIGLGIEGAVRGSLNSEEIVVVTALDVIDAKVLAVDARVRDVNRDDVACVDRSSLSQDELRRAVSVEGFIKRGGGSLKAVVCEERNFRVSVQFWSQ